MSLSQIHLDVYVLSLTQIHGMPLLPPGSISSRGLLELNTIAQTSKKICETHYHYMIDGVVVCYTNMGTEGPTI